MPIVYLARHATPDWSRKEIPYHLPPGPPLTPAGVEEAQRLGSFLRQAGVRTIYASPLERALHTAQIISQVSGAPYTVQPGLIEWQPEDTDTRVLERCYPVFELALGAAQPVCLVTHGSPVETMLRRLGLAEEALPSLKVYDHGCLVPPAGCWCAKANGNGWKLELAFTP